MEIFLQRQLVSLTFSCTRILVVHSDHVMKAQTSDTRLEQSKVTPRTRGRTVNDQLATMAHQIEVIEDTSRRLIHEFEGTHYVSLSTSLGKLSIHFS